MLKKITISILIAVYLLFFAIVPVARAQSPQNTWYNQDFKQWYNKVYSTDNPNDIFGERYTAAQVQWVIYGLFAFIINGATNGNQQAIQCAFSPNAAACLKNVFPNISLPPGGMAPQQSMLSLIFEDRPLSGITYVKNIIRKFHLIPQANAQVNPGFGYDALSFIRNLWQITRNVSYTLFVVVIIAMAFMIMFRVKISPQVVITVQSALPKLVVAIILVTFSYAIAGFMVDLMYVVIGILSLILQPFVAQYTGAISTAYSILRVLSPVLPQVSFDTRALVFDFMTIGPAGLGVFGLVISYLLTFAVSVLVVLLGTSAQGVLSVNPLNPAGPAIGLGIGGILAIIAVIILIIILVFICIKIIFMLFKTFATLILLVIFAPLQITLGVLVPGIGFGAWLRSFLTSLAVFPTVGTLFLISYIFLVTAMQQALNIGGSALSSAFGTAGWPPLLGSGSGANALLFIGVSFVILSLIPKSVEVIQGLISGRPFAYGTAIREAVVGPFAGAARAGGFGIEVGEQALVIADILSQWNRGGRRFRDIPAAFRFGTRRSTPGGGSTSGGSGTTDIRETLPPSSTG